MQAIITKYLPATNTKSSRVKATCARGSLVVSYPHDLSGDAIHDYAAAMLISRFLNEDREEYGTEPHKNPWGKKRILGTLPDGNVAHVFTA